MECKAVRLRLSKESSNHSALPVLTTEMFRPIVKPCILYDGRCEDIPVLKVKLKKLNQLTRVNLLSLPDSLRALLYNPGLLFNLDYITAIVNPFAVKFL